MSDSKYLLRFNCGDGETRELVVDGPVRYDIGEQVGFTNWDLRRDAPKNNLIWSLSGLVEDVQYDWEMQPENPDEPWGKTNNLRLSITTLSLKIKKWEINNSIEPPPQSSA